MLNKVKFEMLIIAVFAIISSGCNKDESLTYGTMKDQEGNEYKTITIGTQTWMAENLRTTSYCNGDSIIKVISLNSDWRLKGGYRDYPWITDSENMAIYGRLYTWKAVSNSSNIAPIGWHVPTDEEWTILITFLGGDDVAGDKMKEMGTTHWADPMKESGTTPTSIATNESGFSALAAGAIRAEGIPTVKGYYSFFWSSTQFDNTNAWGRSLVFDKSKCFHFTDDKNYLFSVRLVKD